MPLRLACLAAAAAAAAAALALPAAAQERPTILGRPAPVNDNAVLLRVRRVQLPAKIPGDCRVVGVVGKVLFGSAYMVGQQVTLDVPCGVQPAVDKRPARPDGIKQGVDAQVLKSSTTGIARLDDQGRLIWTAPPVPLRGVPGMTGLITGYRVLDPVFLPASPAKRTS